LYRTRVGTFCSGQVHDFCFIKVAGGAFTFRNNSFLDMASDDHLMLVCPAACVVICEDEKERRKHRYMVGKNVFNETVYPRYPPVNSK
jgi:hypothetical protein